MTEYEHTQALRDVEAAVTTLRNRIRKLHWIAGGKGYDNMGKRELENARNRADEAAFWIAAASRSLNAGAQRYESLPADPAAEGDA